MTQPKMTNAALIADIAKNCGQSQTIVKAVLHGLVTEVDGALNRGESVSIPGIATLTPKERPARIGRNPTSGQPVDIPARRVATARIAPALTRALN